MSTFIEKHLFKIFKYDFFVYANKITLTQFFSLTYFDLSLKSNPAYLKLQSSKRY